MIYRTIPPNSFSSPQCTPVTNRRFRLFFYVDYVENALYVRWSALGLGRVTYFDRFIFTLAAPITVFSWLLGCFTNRFRGDVALGSDIEHTYDYIDIT